jgi:kojibiose phosphorylase
MNSMSDCWTIVEDRFRPERNKSFEGLFTLGSGYLHIRGSLEEHLADAPQNIAYPRTPANVTSEKFPETKAKWGTYVPGIFARHPMLGEEMVNLPWVLGLAPIVIGERMDVEKGQIERYRRELDLKKAMLRREVTWRTRRGVRVEVKFERFVSAVRKHLVIQRMTVEADQPAELLVEAGIDADVLTNGHDHFRSVHLSAGGEDGITASVELDSGEAVTIDSRLRGATGWRYEAGPRTAIRRASVSLRPKQAVVIEKRTTIHTSRDLEKPAERGGPAFETVRYEQLFDEHAAAWAKRWESCDVLVEGDDEAQLAARVAHYHLLRVHVPDDPRVAIDPKGYAGDAYWGRFFWDTEAMLLPFYLYTEPDRARTLVDYRVQSLAGARENAARYGYPGARYAWEADSRGRECCPNWQYADHEVHVTADVVYGLVHYARAAGDPGYLRGAAAAVLVETARYWTARIDWRRGDDYPSILGVMGPDEFTPISSNNAYTNALVRFALNAAAEVGPSAGATEEECRAFREVAAKLPIQRGADGVLILQCEEFERLAEPRFDEFWKDRRLTFAAQVSQERMYRSKCLKQADVLMLMSLFPGDFSDAEVARAWEYYVPYTTHDSSLSPGVHAIIALRLGRLDEAVSFWNRAKGLDLDTEGSGAAEGIHISNAGLVWQMLVMGFAGMATAMAGEVLSFRPQLPPKWSKLAFPVVWRGQRAFAEFTPKAGRITNRSDRPLEVQVDGVRQTIAPGATATWPR